MIIAPAAMASSSRPMIAMRSSRNGGRRIRLVDVDRLGRGVGDRRRARTRGGRRLDLA